VVCGKDGSDHGTGDGNLGKLEGDGTGVSHHAGLILISLNWRDVSDQSAMASGRSMQPEATLPGFRTAPKRRGQTARARHPARASPVNRRPN